jgi:site-specific recombinase XerD
MRVNRYSPRTEQAYIDWIKRFIRFHGVRHPNEMGAEEVKAFLSHLATEMNVAASTQNQAFSALLFLYQEVLKARLPWIDDIVSPRVKKKSRSPLFELAFVLVCLNHVARFIVNADHGVM